MIVETVPLGHEFPSVDFLKLRLVVSRKRLHAPVLCPVKKISFDVVIKERYPKLIGSEVEKSEDRFRSRVPS